MFTLFKKNENQFNKIPNELMVEIIKLTGYEDILRLALVDRRFYAVTQGETFFERNIFTAAKHNLVKKIEALLSSRKTPDLNIISNALRIAVICNAYEAAAFFIKKGIDVNNRISGKTHLHLAVIFENAKIAKLLIDHGADINATNDKGQKPAEVYPNKLLSASIQSNANWEEAFAEEIRIKDKERTQFNLLLSRK